MESFLIRKNTLPYVYQWAVIDSQTGNEVGYYKTLKNAEIACRNFIKYGLQDTNTTKTTNTKNAYDMATKRMNKPDGDKPRPIPKHSHKRPVELD